MNINGNVVPASAVALPVLGILSGTAGLLYLFFTYAPAMSSSGYALGVATIIFAVLLPGILLFMRGLALPVLGMMIGGGLMLYGTEIMTPQDAIAVRDQTATTVAHLRAENCRLVEIDTWRRSAFNCKGVTVWYGSYITAAWLNGAEP